MTFPAKPTTHDLSDIRELAAFPSFHSSMAGGNMVTEKSKFFAGRGSDTEAVHDVVAATMTDFGNQQSPPELPGPDAVTDKDLGTDVKATGSAGSSRAWEKMH